MVAGLVSAGIAKRLGVAGVTGQVLVGVLLGHSGLELFSHEDVESLSPMTGFALGLISLSVGGHLNFRRLRNARKRLGLLVLAEVIITPALVHFAVLAVGGSWRLAILLSALAISTAPATIVALVHEQRARGVFTKTLVGAVALNNIAGIALFAVAHMEARVGLDGAAAPALLDYVIAPTKQLLSSILLGGATGALLVLSTRHVVRPERLATASVITVLLTAGLAEAFDISALLACLMLGVTLANLTPDKDEIVESAFVNVRAAIFAIFFTLAGMHLDLGSVVPAGGMLVVGVPGHRPGAGQGDRPPTLRAARGGRDRTCPAIPGWASRSCPRPAWRWGCC